MLFKAAQSRHAVLTYALPEFIFCAVKSIICLFLLLCISLSPLPARALDLSLGPRHYGREMEFYYQKPRPEMLAPMLANLERTSFLANAEKRLFIAAFLASLALARKLDLASLAAGPCGRDASLTVAWAAHLCCLPDKDKLLAKLLTGKDQTTLARINQSPAPLTTWDPAWEKSALNMHWAAFMATGQDLWIDKIIKTALGYAHNRKGGAAAAASLYDYAPRHAAVRRRLLAARQTASEREKEVLDTILAQKAKLNN